MRTSVFEYDAFVKGLFSKMFVVLATVIYIITVYQQTSKREKSLVSFMHEQNIICSQAQSQTQFDDIAREQTIICTGSYLQVTWRAFGQ